MKYQLWRLWGAFSRGRITPVTHNYDLIQKSKFYNMDNIIDPRFFMSLFEIKWLNSNKDKGGTVSVVVHKLIVTIIIGVNPCCNYINSSIIYASGVLLLTIYYYFFWYPCNNKS